MKTIPIILLLSVFFACSSRLVGAVLTFDDWQTSDTDRLPPRTYYISIADANESVYGVHTYVYGGVTWDSDWWLVGDEFVAHSSDASDWFSSNGPGPFALPHSGHYALFNGAGFTHLLGFSTTQILTGVWLGRPCLGDCPGGAIQVTVTAWMDSNALASVSLDLADLEPAFLDTRSFLGLTGITRYTADFVAGPGIGFDGEFFIADDFVFAPMSLAESCPCDGAWKNHAEYVRCVRDAVALLREDGSLTSDQAKDLIKDAQGSDCGDKHPR